MKKKTSARKRTKTAAARRVVKLAPADAPAAIVEPAAAIAPAQIRVHIHPKKVEIFEGDATEPHSRIANGAEGSDASFKVAEMLDKLTQSGAQLTVRRFDAAGQPINNGELF